VDNEITTKVLVIDDDQSVFETLKLVLEPNTFQTSIATSASQALHLIEVDPPDVIIIDLHLSRMDCCTMTGKIRTHTQIPILILSSVNKPDLVVKALENGADEYLTKPVPGNVLMAHIKRLAHRARAEVLSQNYTM
jgi:two-component system KDP operon response regulator KdpE